MTDQEQAPLDRSDQFYADFAKLRMEWPQAARHWWAALKARDEHLSATYKVIVQLRDDLKAAQQQYQIACDLVEQTEVERDDYSRDLARVEVERDQYRHAIDVMFPDHALQARITELEGSLRDLHDATARFAEVPHQIIYEDDYETLWAARIASSKALAPAQTPAAS